MRTKASWSIRWACVMLCAATAVAQTRVWTSTNNGVWSDGANWLGGGVPPVAGATIHFPNLQSGTVTATVDAAWSATGAVDGLVFDVGNANNDWLGNYVIDASGGAGLTLGSGGITVLDDYDTSSAAGTNHLEIAANLTLTASQAWNVQPYAPSTPSAAGPSGNSGGTVLRLSGQVSGASPGTVFTKSGVWYMEVRGPNGGFSTNIAAIVLAGGRFNIVNGLTTGNSLDRIGDNTAIIGKGGTWYRSRSAGVIGTEYMGQLSFVEGLTQVSGAGAVDGLQSNLLYRFASFDPNVGPSAAFFYTAFSQCDMVFSDLAGIPSRNGIVGGWAIFNDNAQFQWLVKPTTTNNTFTGLTGTDVNSATLNGATAAQNLNLTTDTNFLLTADRTFNSLRYRGPTNGTLNLGGYQLRIDSGGFLHASATTNATFTITNGTLTVGAVADRPGSLYFAGGSTALTHPIDIAATITDNGTGAVNVVQYNLTSSGTLTLRGPNSYTGFTADNYGDVVFYWDGTNAGDNAPLGKVPASYVRDNIRLAGGRLRPAASMMLHTNRGILLGGVGGTINATGTFTNNGAISGSGDLQYNGNFVLGGTQPNTYTGNTVIAATTLVNLSKNGANAVPGNLFIVGGNAASATPTVRLGGSEEIADDGVVTLVRPWGSGGGSTGVALWQLYGYDETIGSLVGTVAAGNTNSSGLVVENGNPAASASTLVLAPPAGGYSSYQGMLRDGTNGIPSTLAVVKTGAGIQELGGMNQYSGGTVISNGTLLASAPAAGQPVVVSGYTTATNPVVTNVSSIVGLAVGQFVTNATTVPASLPGKFIVSIDSTNQITLSGNATSNGLRTIYFGACSSLGAGPVSVNGGTLGGTGAVYGAVTVTSGAVDPGAWPGTVGTLTVSNLTFQSGGSLTVDLAGDATNDQVVVNGNLTLGGAVSVNPVGGYAPQAGQSWTILTSSGTIDDSVTMQAPAGYRVQKVGFAVLLSKVAVGSTITVR